MNKEQLSKHIDNTLLKNAKTLSNQNFIEVHPFKHNYKKYFANECHWNVRELIRKSGGKRIRGWRFEVNLFRIIACFHSVWQAPSGKYFDPTPTPYEHKAKYSFLPHDKQTELMGDITNFDPDLSQFNQFFPLFNNKECKKAVLAERRRDYMLDKLERVDSIPFEFFCNLSNSELEMLTKLPLSELKQRFNQ